MVEVVIMVILVVIVVVNGRGESGHGDGGRGVDEQTRSLLWLLGFLIFFYLKQILSETLVV